MLPPHWHHWIAALLAVVALTATAAAQSSGNRVLGIDVSAWQGSISQTTWNNIRAVENRQFAFIRATRGGTTGVDKRNGGYPANDDTAFSLSQRYDDPYFVQNVNRATAAGMFVGSYHFARPDIITTTTSSGGIANTASDEADHFIQMAGAFMRPGYLPPTFDLEAGDGIRTDNDLAQYSIDFSNRVFEVTKIRPMIYINGNYAQNVLAGATLARRDQLAKPATTPPSLASPAYAKLWIARYQNQANPDSINVQTGNPSDGLSTVYGPWDDYGSSQPWVFWQYASTGRLTSFNSGNSNLDFNVLNGGMEYLEDQLVPAVWWNDTSGDWGTLTNWNSGQPVTALVSATGQLAPIGTQTLPTPRLPGASGTAPTSGQYDTVILDRPTANITVTLSTGTYNIRKLYVRERFAMSGGSLTVNYVPVAESTPMSMQVSSSAALSGGARLSAHTILVDATQNLTAGGASLTFDTLTLSRGTTPATLTLNGDVTIAGTSGTTASIVTNSGTAATGRLDLGGGSRTITVANGAAAVDLLIAVPILNGSLGKAGPGTMRLTAASTFSGSTTIQQGTLQLAHPSALAASKLTPLVGGLLSLTPNLQTTIGGLAPTAGGLVDVGTGMITVASGLSTSDLVAALQSGRGDGSWTGSSGITSTAVASALAQGVSRSVGWLDNGNGSMSFAYAAPGDTNVDNQVDVLDAANFLAGGKFDTGLPATWLEGDFNYDGMTDVLDAADFLNAGLFDAGPYNAISGTIAAVPEPDMPWLAVVVLTVLGWMAARSAAVSRA
jgi:autotransporter-associated beta strand protein